MFNSMSLSRNLFMFIPGHFKDNVYRFIRFFRDNTRLALELIVIHYNTISLSSKEYTERNCHFLICKNPKYVGVSKYAIFSYMRHHPLDKVIIHCDKVTLTKVKKLYRFIPVKNIEIHEDISSDMYPYVSKGLLILSLQGTKDLFIDADTRINGTITNFELPTALVSEFKFGESKKFSLILHAMGVQHFEEKYLLNVSFVTWGGRNLGITSNEFVLWSDKYLNLNWEDLLSAEAINYFKRFVEQTFFSLIFQSGEWKVLKSKDKVGDGGVIESSYFGASGYRFGR